MTKIAILDDYQNVAMSMADWRSLPAGVSAEAFSDHLADEDAVARRLAPFGIAVAMRERTPFPRSLLERLPNLRLLVTTGMRNAAIDLAAASELGVTVCGTNGLAQPTAELTWGLILALARRIPLEDAAVKRGAWQVSVGEGVHGKTLGVMGLGRLGSQVARVGVAFGMNVLAWSQNLTAERAADCGAALALSKDALMAESDFLTIHLILSRRTRGLVGERELALMKPSAYLVNTSRGPIVDESALIAALRSNAIAGAGLDVFNEEPLPPDHPFRSLPNIVITPHMGYVTAETYRVFYGDAVENIAAFLNGAPIRTLTERR